MNDPNAVGRVLLAANFDPQGLLTLANEPNTKDALKMATQDAVMRGIFGAPLFLLATRCSGAKTVWIL